MEFQKNDIKFKTNKTLLDKAESFKPKLKYKEIIPKSIVKVINDNSIYGYGTKKIKDIIELHNLTLGKGEKVILDLGDHYVGHFSINMNSVGSPMDAPLFLHLKFCEIPIELTENSDNYNGALSKSWLQDEYIHVDTLPQTLTLKRRYACRYVLLDVIDTSPKWKVQFSDPKFISQSSVDLSNISPVKTGDELLDKIDRVGLKTLQDCMQQVFEDGPKRDRRLWLGDLRLQALANYATFNDQALVKHCLYLFGALPAEDGRITTNVFTFTHPIPDDSFFYDYGLFFISTLFDYYNQFKDKEVVDDLYEPAKNEINSALKAVNDQNLVDFNQKFFLFVDWNMNFDRHTCAQAILIYALRQFVSLAKIEDNSEDAEHYQDILDKLIVAAKEKLFDKEQGLFISGKKCEVNIASQVWMVLAHVLNDADNEKLMNKAIEKLFPVHNIATPYMYHHIVVALFESNHYNEAVNLIKDYWGKMVNGGADTFWEAFDPDDPAASPYGSLSINSFCHAWSCTPVYLIRKYITKEFDK